MAAPFDLERLRLNGDAVLLAAGVAVRANQRVDMSVSSNGTLTYVSGGSSAGIRELVWVNREGVPTPVDPSWTGEVAGRAALSPDGRYAAASVGRPGARAVWVKQLDRGPATRVAEAGSGPAWSPDGKSLIFSSANGVQRVPADGSALPERVRQPGDSALFGPGVAGNTYSADGKWIVRQYRSDIHATRTDGDTAHVVIADANNQTGPALSPNGRWLAYSSDESGTFQVYVRPFPNVRLAKRQVSINSGFAPRWSRSGTELFYMDATTDIWATVVSTGDVFTNGTPKLLFSALPYAPVAANPFDVSPDGRRFLFSRVVGGATAERPDELIVVQNFFEELKAKVPRRK